MSSRSSRSARHRRRFAFSPFLTRPLAIGLASFGVVALGACGALIGTRDLTETSGDDGGNDSGARVDGNTVLPDGAVVPPANDGGDAATTPSDGGDGGSNVNDGGNDGSTSCVGADLQTNKHNCGVCGHDCLGGDCTGGVCQAFPLVPNQAGAHGITVDATNVYWTCSTTGQVLKANLDGSSVTQLSAISGALPFEIAVDATNVYWTTVNTEKDTTPGRVERCAKSGCPSGPTPLTPGVREAYALAIDGVSAYWSEWDNGAIGRVNEADGGGFGYLATGHGFISGAAFDNGTVYFTSSDGIAAVAANGSLVAAQTDTATTPVRTIYPTTGTGDFNPVGIAVDGTNVYWANDAIISGAILYAPKGATGATPNALSAHDISPTHVALDANNVYWIALGPSGSDSAYVAGYLATCPKTGCIGAAPTVLAKDLHNPHGLAVDGTAVYFTIHGNAATSDTTVGSVMKIAK